MCAFHTAPPPLVPTGLAPEAVDSARAWAGATLPRHAAALTFKWKFEDRRRSGGGRGMARIAAPDTLRVDWRAVLGLASGAAVVLGDSLAWVDPKDSSGGPPPPWAGVAQAWAALGVARPPVAGAVVSRGGDARVSLWRFAAGPDTLDYRASVGPPRSLEWEWRRAGTRMIRGRSLLDERGFPTSARIDAPRQGARFEFTVLAVDTAPSFAPQIWRSRR